MSQESETHNKELLRLGGQIIHRAQCARDYWKSGNSEAALIMYDRCDHSMGKLFNLLQKNDPDLAKNLLEAAENANEGK